MNYLRQSLLGSGVQGVDTEPLIPDLPTNESLTVQNAKLAVLQLMDEHKLLTIENVPHKSNER